MIRSVTTDSRGPKSPACSRSFSHSPALVRIIGVGLRHGLAAPALGSIGLGHPKCAVYYADAPILVRVLGGFGPLVLARRVVVSSVVAASAKIQGRILFSLPFERTIRSYIPA